MELFKILLMLVSARYSCCGYTGYNILLWLSSDEQVSPSDVWSDSNSTYNNASNTTSTEFLQAGTRGYRNTFIDAWASNPPNRTRVTYRGKDGNILFKAKFNSSGSSYIDWFAVSNVIGNSWPALTFELSHSYTSYRLDFTMSDRTFDSPRYRAASLKMPNGTILYIVGEGRSFAFLPATPTAAEDCYASYQTSNQFSINVTTTNMTHIYCSGFCRDRNYPYGGVHGETCSCLDAAATGPTLTACTEPCAGNTDEMCGSTLPPAIIFNSVNTDIDVRQFDGSFKLLDEVQVNGETAMISYQKALHLCGFNMTIASVYLPVSIRMVLQFRAELCSGELIPNSTYQETFSVDASAAYFILELGPLLVQCIYITLYDSNTNNVITFPINLAILSLKEDSFVTAKYFTVEASWQTVEEQTTTTSTTPTPSTPTPSTSTPSTSTPSTPTPSTSTPSTPTPYTPTPSTSTPSTSTPTTPTPTEECECECWVYNLLYGDSPYNNLSYKQIEDALRNVTQQIVKELAVNKTLLSSTIRKKTSAEDKRTSAIAVGYLLGVVLLVTSLGAILVSDFPKMIGSFNILIENCKSRFGKTQAEKLFDVHKTKIARREATLETSRILTLRRRSKNGI